MNALLFLLLPLCHQVLAPDEVGINKLGWSAFAHDTAVFCYVPIGGKMFAWHLAFFSFETGKVTLIEDGRITGYLPYIVPTREGFALIQAKLIFGERVIFLDKQGNYLNTRAIADIEGWNPDLEHSYIFAFKEDESLMTFKHKKEQRYLLGDLDINTYTLRYLADQPVLDTHKRVWFRDHTDVYIIVKETAWVGLVDIENHAVKTLRQGIDPVLDKPIFREIGDKHKHILGMPIFNGRYASIRWLKPAGVQGNYSEKSQVQYMELESRVQRQRAERVIGIFKKRALVYDRELGELQVIPFDN